MRLGYLVPEFPGQTHVFFWREINALRKMGAEVVLLSTRRPIPITCRHEFALSAAAETHYVFPPAVASISDWAASGLPRSAAAIRYLSKLEASGLKNRLRQSLLLASAIDLLRWTRRAQINHIHVHSTADAAHVVALARLLGGAPYSLTLHGDLEVYGTDHKSKMCGAAFIHAVGTHLRHQVIKEVGVSTERVFVTCMGVDVSALAKLGQDRRYDSGQLHLVTVARLNSAKGLTHALAAVSRAIDAGLDVRYTIAGDGPFREALVARVAELGLDNRVTLAGTLSETEVFRLLSRADAFALSSTGLGEAWPVSVMEAMGAGLPVIASIIGATPEMITPDVDGYLVPQRDEDALLEKISLLARDVSARRRIGAAARHTARQRFDVSVTAHTLLDHVQRWGPAS